ncbi:hypothetical protein GQR58_029009 [Nymphon striatum]|nr:hypothetical protein GQR58_029009 [Nymphon striatum]
MGRALLNCLPPAKHMLADRGYDADWYREALEEQAVKPCIPSRQGRKVQIPHDEIRCRKRHKIENCDARLRDWRRIATRYDRCPKVFLSACAFAAVAMFCVFLAEDIIQNSGICQAIAMRVEDEYVIAEKDF